MPLGIKVIKNGHDLRELLEAFPDSEYKIERPPSHVQALFWRVSVRTLKLKFKVTTSPFFHSRATLNTVPLSGCLGVASPAIETSAWFDHVGILKWSGKLSGSLQ